MNSQELLDLIGQAQDIYVREASGTRHRRIWWVAAACLCAALICGTVLHSLSGAGLECYLLDTQNGSPAGAVLEWAEETQYWGQGIFQSEAAKPTVTVTFDGREYTGYYKYSICPVGQGIIKDYYEPEDPKTADFDEFSVVNGTGELAYISLLTQALLEEMEQQPRLGDTASALEALAFQWASLFIETDTYTFRLVRGEYGAGIGDVRNYLYEFVRTVDGVDTTDKLTVLLTDRGKLIYIGVGHLGWTEEKRTQLFRFRMADTESLVSEALKGLQYRITEQTYGVTPQGEVVLMVKCEVALSVGGSCGMVVLIKAAGSKALLY